MAHPGTAHKYSKRRIAFEHASSSSSASSTTPNTLLWVGGLSDGLLTVPYPTQIAKSLPSSWTISEVLLSSSYKGWGTGSLSRDARELGECVSYFKNLRPGKKIVVMGHSTGCQDIMEYLVGKEHEKREGLDAVILQGGVSDREAWEVFGKNGREKKALEEAIKMAKGMVDAGKGKEILPREGNAVLEEMGGPLSAYRAYSLLAKDGDDDYFSSDLSDEHFAQTFGKIPQSTPVCFLLGSEDPYVPASIDRASLLQRWTRIIREGGGVVDDEDGGVVPGAHHNLEGDSDEVVQDLVRRVCGFLDGLESERKWKSAASRL
ncbi:dolichol-phosphate mannosyltransferase [Pyrenophora seminiperda CCB06]|uniref:Dolichol-phosphate mannosyltransferase n=1 Tax=Pyrenophora seminiperda CCB06 TaxID=1302712 RepID=A0A3M7M7L9_9PLEO|nr:dolichol-phosphate mannosyltransferase [Pyrenophora seminiperda CCB06]